MASAFGHLLGYFINVKQNHPAGSTRRSWSFNRTIGTAMHSGRARVLYTNTCRRIPARPVVSYRPTAPSAMAGPAASRCYQQLANLTTDFRTHSATLSSQNLSDLGLRSQLPPDSLPDPNQDAPPEVPDQEWEIRTGRAIYVIRETLPDFFNTGLVTSINKMTGAPRTPSTVSTFTPTAATNFLEHFVLKDDEEPIYSPNVRLAYTPPVALPPPIPKTLHVEGIQLYLASSNIIRHTMNALYSDLAVQVSKLVVNTPTPSSPPADSSKKRRISREKNFVIRQHVTGVARVSGKQGEWEIESTYTFSPATGLIHQHIVNSIHPTPHQAVYDSLRSGFGKMLGLGWGSGTGTGAANGAACKVKRPQAK